MKAAAGVGCLGYGRVLEVGKPRSRPGGQAQRLGWVEQGSGKDSTGAICRSRVVGIRLMMMFDLPVKGSPVKLARRCFQYQSLESPVKARVGIVTFLSERWRMFFVGGTKFVVGIHTRLGPLHHASQEKHQIKQEPRSSRCRRSAQTFVNRRYVFSSHEPAARTCRENICFCPHPLQGNKGLPGAFAGQPRPQATTKWPPP